MCAMVERCLFPNDLEELSQCKSISAEGPLSNSGEILSRNVSMNSERRTDREGRSESEAASLNFENYSA